MLVQCHISSTLTLYIVDAVIPPYSKSKPGHRPTLLADDDRVTGAEANKSKVARLAKVPNIFGTPIFFGPNTFGLIVWDQIF